MKDIDVNTGLMIEGADLLRQRIVRLLSTRKGSLVLNRDYGASLFEYIDVPAQTQGILIKSEIAKALTEFFPEIEVKKVKTDTSIPGQLDLSIVYSLKGGESLSLELGRIRFG